MRLSQLATSIPPSATVRLNATARALKQRGEPVIHMGVGEPQNQAPEAAIQAGLEVLQKGYIKYAPTPGLPGLRQAIVQYTEEAYGRRVAVENVIVSVGAKHALFNLLYALLDPDDEAIILTPYWVSYPEMVRMVRGRPVIVNPPPGEYIPRLEDIEKAVTPATRLIIVNNPNNPSGLTYPEEFIAALVDFCERRQIFYLSDDIYHQLVFDGQSPPNVYQYTTRAVDESYVIVINGVSKLFGMTGFRIGWVVAPKPIVEVLATIQSQSTTCNPVVDQVAAEAALLQAKEDVTRLRSYLEGNRDAVLAELAKTPAIKTPRASGAFYCFPDFSAFQSDSVALSNFLLEKALVVTVPGKEFGIEGHLRLSYCGEREEMVEGVRRIRWALDPNTPPEIVIGGKTVVRDWL